MGSLSADISSYDILTGALETDFTDAVIELTKISMSIGAGLCIVFFSYRLYMLNRDSALGEDVERAIADTIIKTTLAVLLIVKYDFFLETLSTLFAKADVAFGWEGAQSAFFDAIKSNYVPPSDAKNDLTTIGMIKAFFQGKMMDTVMRNLLTGLYGATCLFPFAALIIQKLVFNLFCGYLTIIGPMVLATVILPNASKTVAAGWFRSMLAVFTMPLLWAIFFKFGNKLITNNINEILNMMREGAVVAVVFRVILGIVRKVIVDLILTIAILFSYKTANSLYTGIFAASGANVGPGIVNVLTFGLLKLK